ncbi:lipopolysaccharide biosynthesis protein [Microbacterium trichothecenolyticum]|uniref:Teichuronic acid biosynthesis protein TuaB n=1 Tax=Microbacterium trichothecenolyticum TaxID=69370 RepID=A0A0M2H1S6_MICTR|nr:lipopolysaccharide biosynthesis protein [Microbacterium trichothecenolyticum]KJL40338.1 Teichuronic acid biosynthesis protein TuaB [Microbacterium trichothecenolyticum]
MTSAPSNLSHRASRGAAVTAGGLWMRTLLQLVSTMVLARLLEPADFGLVAMIMAIVGVADLVRDFGLTGAILQARDLTTRQWSGLLWFSAALGAGLMVAVAACAPLIAALYGEDRLVILTLAIAPTLLLNGIAMPMQAAVQRQLRFGTLAMIDIASMAAGVVLSVVAALLGWGVWSLVVLAGAGQIYRLVALWIAAKPRWGVPRIGRDIRPFVSTGGSIFGVQLLNYAARNLDNVIIGQQLGSAALGQYSRAYSLFLLPQQQLTAPLGRVALPVLSRLQDDAERYRRYVRGAFTVIGYLALTAYAVAAAVAHPLMLVLLGPGWDAAADVFALLAIAGVAQAVGNVQGWMYISLGRAHRQFVYYLITRPLVIASFFVGIWWNGMNGLALLYGLVTVVLLVPGFIVAIHGTFVRGWTDIAVPLARPALVAAGAFGAAAGITMVVSSWPAILQVVAGALGGLAVLAVAWLVPAVRRDYRMMFDFVRQARRPAAGTGSDEAPAPTGDLPTDAEAAQLGADEISAGELEGMLREEDDRRRSRR